LETHAAVAACKFLGETAGFWVQTVILFVSAIAAIWVIYANGHAEKRRATVDLVIQQKQDKELQDALLHIRELREKKVSNFAKYLEDHNSVDFKAIIRVLNNYEFIASGIEEGAFDEELFKRMQHSVLLNNWGALCGFVMEFRRQNSLPTLFQEFQKLARKWESHPLKKYDF
jgi:hypothetical protein